MLLWRDYFHLLPVVGELFATVQADDVRGRGVFSFRRKCPRLLGGYQVTGPAPRNGASPGLRTAERDGSRVMGTTGIYPEG